MTKSEFIDHLFEHNWLWSYDRKAKDQLSEKVIIEHALLYGDVDELKQLFFLFQPAAIEAVWLEKLVPQSRYKKLNTYLAKFFFCIPDAEEFINDRILEYPRLERFRLFTAEN